MSVRDEIREHNRNLAMNPPTDRTYYQDEAGKVSKRKPLMIVRSVRARSIREAIARCNMAKASEVSETRRDSAFKRQYAGTMAEAFVSAFGLSKLRESLS